MSWYNVGFGPHIEESEAQERKSRQPLRFWLAPGEERSVVVLDDEPFFFWEHNLKLGGKWGNYFTCLKGVWPENPICPLCERGERRQYVGVVTVFDLTTYTSQYDGQEHFSGRRLFVMNKKAWERFRVLKERAGGSLVGKVLVCYRSDSKSPRIGDNIDLSDEEVDVARDKRFWWQERSSGVLRPPEPFDYVEIFKPMKHAELMATVKARSEAAAFDIGSGGSDDVPF